MRIIDLHFQGIRKSIACFFFSDSGLLVETGPHSTFVSLQKALSETGHGVKDIRHVLLTHIHLDHAGAAWALAREGAKIYVHPAGYKHLAQPEKLWQSAKRIYQDKMESLWGEMQPISESQLVATEDKQVLRFGERTFVSHHTPGHAKHHIAWQHQDTLFTGDAAGVKLCPEGPVIAPCPPPDIDLEAWEQSIQRIESLNCEELILTHYGQVSSPAQHLKELRSSLSQLSQWIQKRFHADTNPKQLVAPFEKYIKAQLASCGLDEGQIKQYEAANPPWMSVYGLARYWTQKTTP